MAVRSESRGPRRGRVGSRHRRAKLIVIVSTVAASVLAISVGQTGAYFTGAASTASQTASAATLPAPASLTVTKTGATTGQSSAVSWAAPTTRPWEAAAGSGGAIEYTVSRNTVDAFGPAAGAVQVYKGTATSVTDASGSAPVSLASQVVGFQKMDASAALINGVPYRWGLSFRINADRSEARSNIWQGASGQTEFNTGVLTEMQFANSSEKEELTSLAPGRDHICALSVTKKVFCMGFGHLLGQTGTATDSTATTSGSVVQWNRLQDPRGVFTGKSIIQVTSGEMFSCALASDGTIGCWGINDYKQLGNGGYTAASIGAPIKVAQASGADWSAFAVNKPVMIAAGATHVCAVKGLGANGEVPSAPVACWGAADKSQLGDYSAATTSAEPRDVADPNGELTGVKAITAGTDATCVVNDKTSTTNVACWGWGGLLGRASGSSAPANSGTPAAITSSVKGFTNLDMSSSHACGAAGASVVCWGANSFGKLGSGTAGDGFATPTAVVDTDSAFQGQKIIGAGTGWSHSCAATERGSIACWGLGAQYQLGQGSSATDGGSNGQTIKPVTILFNGSKMKPKGADLISQSGDEGYVLARINGGFYSWGGPNRNAPTVLSGFPDGITKLVSSYSHGCAITGVDSKIYCVGDASGGALGNNSTTIGSPTSAVTVADTRGIFTGKIVIDVAAAFQSTCALASDGTVGCWGRGDYGQLGTATRGSSGVPLLFNNSGSFSGSGKPLSIGGGYMSYCVTTAVNVQCWGDNSSRMLGRSTSGTQDPEAAAVSGANLLGGVSRVVGGRQNFCALKTDGTIYCWGWSGGVLGPNVPATTTPTKINGAGYTDISVSSNNACAVTSESTVPRCWGLESGGRLGRGEPWVNNVQRSPGDVADPDGELARAGVAALSGGSATCAMTRSGRIYCWGPGGQGQLAQDGQTADRGVPVRALLSANNPIGSVGVCLDGAVAVTVDSSPACTLVPSRSYYYQVTYSVTSVPNWVSARKSASR